MYIFEKKSMASRGHLVIYDYCPFLYSLTIFKSFWGGWAGIYLGNLLGFDGEILGTSQQHKTTAELLNLSQEGTFYFS